MLTLAGLLIIALIVTLMVTERISPVVALAVIPLLGALAVGFSFEEISGYFTKGIGDVVDVLVMFMFSILFFGAMQEAGLFDPLVRYAIRVTKGSVVKVTVASAVVACIIHLDGSGAVTALITIPAFLPIYRRLGMNPLLLLMMFAGAVGVMNLTPWGGPVGRAALVIKTDPNALWHAILPAQALGLVMLLGMAVVYGYREKRLIAARGPVLQEHEHDASHEQGELPRLFWANLVITLATVAALVVNFLPISYVFILAFCVTIVVNFPRPKEQMECIKRQAPEALSLVAIVCAAAAFLGIMQGTGMIDALAKALAGFLPQFLVSHIHIVSGILGTPLDMLTSSDSYFFGVLPVTVEIARQYGVSPESVAKAMVIGNNLGKMLSPFAPAVWLAVGLTGNTFGQHIRYSFLPLWIFSIVLLLLSVAIGVV